MKYQLPLILLLVLCFPTKNALAGSARYCNGIATLAKDYVEDRDNRQSYQVTLSSVPYTLRDAKLPPSEEAKYRRDMITSIRWIYKDFPKLSQEGAYKLIYAACMQDDLR